MGIKVRCPSCGHEFMVHGDEGGPIMSGQEVVTCFECDSMFNPDKNRANPPDPDDPRNQEVRRY